MSRARRALAALSFVLFGSCLMHPLRADVASAAPTIDCAPALEIDGHLHCGAAGPVALGQRCGPEWSVATSGDAVRTGPACARAGRMAGPELEALGVPVDLNGASVEELESLPGIGPVLARRIAASRPFERVEDLDRVAGIGPVRLAALRRRARVADPRPHAL